MLRQEGAHLGRILSVDLAELDRGVVGGESLRTHLDIGEPVALEHARALAIEQDRATRKVLVHGALEFERMVLLLTNDFDTRELELVERLFKLALGVVPHNDGAALGRVHLAERTYELGLDVGTFHSCSYLVFKRSSRCLA